ncbi:MAG: PIG-L deacetylase family protein [Candidatus Saccharimonadales bacterium]
MKKIIFGIFAHPDDEAFGPSGTLLLETKAGTELHLISLTAGQNGTNPNNLNNLKEVRLQEWEEAARLIGATKTYHLGFIDGHLDNIAMIEASKQIEDIIHATVTDNDQVEVEFMTIDPNGISGHIDHIVASRAASFVFFRQKVADTRFTRIRYACISEIQNPTIRTDWLYMDAGRTQAEITETVDARSLKEEITAIMRCHVTQTSDCEAALSRMGANLGINHFITKS